MQVLQQSVDGSRIGKDPDDYGNQGSEIFVLILIVLTSRALNYNFRKVRSFFRTHPQVPEGQSTSRLTQS